MSLSRAYDLQRRKKLLEVLAVDPLTLTLDLEVPGKSSLEELLVLGLVEVNLGVLVRLVVWSDRDGGDDVLATGNDNTGDDRVVGSTDDTDGTEEVLAGSLKTVEETADLVVGHEGDGQLLVVFEVDAPDGEALGVKVLVEPWDGTLAGVEVGVLTLPLLEVERGLGQVIQGVLSLGLGGDKGLLLLLVGLLGLGLLLSLWLLGLGLLSLWLLSLDRGLESGLGLDELGLAVVKDGGELGVVDDGVDVTDDVGDLLAASLVDETGEGVGEGSNDNDVGEGDALSDEVGLGDEDLVKSLKTSKDSVVDGGEDGLVVWELVVDNHLHANVVLDGDLLVGEAGPLLDLGGGLGVGGDQGLVGAETGN